MTRRTRKVASTRVDIEQAFDARSRRNRTDVPSSSLAVSTMGPNPATSADAPVSAPRKEPLTMAMVRVDPVEVHVRTGWFDGTPREITWGDERLPVTRLNAV